MKIIDDSDAIATYDIPTKIKVDIMPGVIERFSNELLSGSLESLFVKEIYSGNLQNMAKNTISFISILNSYKTTGSNGTSQNIISNNDIWMIKEKFINLAVDMPFSDISSIKVLASVLSILTENTDELTEISAVIFRF